MNHDVNQEDNDLNNPQRLQFKAQEMGLKMCQNIYEKKKISSQFLFVKMHLVLGYVEKKMLQKMF